MEHHQHHEFIAERLATCRRLLSRLVHFDAPPSGDPGEAYRTVSEFAAELLRVSRVSVWRLDEQREQLVCVELYEAESRIHGSGGSLSAAAAPRYFEVLRTQRCVTASDARTNPVTSEFRESYLEPNGIGALLDAPIWVGGRLAGVICHEHVGDSRRWMFGDELLAGTMADFLARVLEAAERRRAERKLGIVRHSEHTFRALLAAAPVALVLAAEQGQRVLALNERAERLLGVSAELARELTLGDLLANSTDADALLARVGKEGVEGHLTRVRARFETEFWALVSIRGLELDGHRCLLVGLTDVTRQKELEQQLVELATRDDLTHTYNRRFFVETAERELARSTRTSAPISLCMIDADLFKNVNDSYGHFVGDRALSALVGAASSALRRHDVLGRMGGEEFAILLPETDRDGALAVAERVRRATETCDVVTDGGERVKLTVSVGVTQHTPGESLERLLQSADAALYRAKAAGRNRVST